MNGHIRYVSRVLDSGATVKQDSATQVAALRQRAAGLREDAKLRPHLRHTLEVMIQQLEEEAQALEGAGQEKLERLESLA